MLESDAFIKQIELHDKGRKRPKTGVFPDFLDVFSDGFIVLHTGA